MKKKRTTSKDHVLNTFSQWRTQKKISERRERGLKKCNTFVNIILYYSLSTRTYTFIYSYINLVFFCKSRGKLWNNCNNLKFVGRVVYFSNFVWYFGEGSNEMETQPNLTELDDREERRGGPSNQSMYPVTIVWEKEKERERADNEIRYESCSRGNIWRIRRMVEQYLNIPCEPDTLIWENRASSPAQVLKYR